jgi:threonine aldolase
MVSFLNDYNTIASKEILEALLKYQAEPNIGYSLDYHTKNAIKILQQKLNTNADIYYLGGGTITNRIGLYQMLKPYEAVICVETGHINVHETGAVESTGHKVLTVKGANGKILIDEVKTLLNDHTDNHKVLPRAIYISNSTEIGTLYTKKELIDIYNFAHQNNLYLFIDGARLGVALASESNDIEFSDYAKYSDMFYIGGTKNGAPFGEALVIVNETLKKNFNYLLKNQGGLFAKGFVLGIVFETLFENDLYFKLAKNSIKYAKELREVFKKANIKEEYINDTNQVFVRLDKATFDKLSKDILFEKWENKGEFIISRFVTNIATNDQDIKEIKKILGIK